MYRRIYDESPVTVIQAEKHWSSKLDHVLEEKQGALEHCKEEITARRARVAWLEQIKADELKDRNLWRSGLVPLPVWRRRLRNMPPRGRQTIQHLPLIRGGRLMKHHWRRVLLEGRQIAL